MHRRAVEGVANGRDHPQLGRRRRRRRSSSASSRCWRRRGGGGGGQQQGGPEAEDQVVEHRRDRSADRPAPTTDGRRGRRSARRGRVPEARDEDSAPAGDGAVVGTFARGQQQAGGQHQGRCAAGLQQRIGLAAAGAHPGQDRVQHQEGAGQQRQQAAVDSASPSVLWLGGARLAPSDDPGRGQKARAATVVTPPQQRQRQGAGRGVEHEAGTQHRRQAHQPPATAVAARPSPG